MHSHNPVSNTEIFLSPLCVEDDALTGEDSSCRFIHSAKWQHREPGLNPLASNRSKHSNVSNSPKRLFHDIYQAVHTALAHPKIILLFPLYHSQQRKETIQVQRVTWRYNQWLQVNELYFTQNALSPTAETFNTGGNGIFGSNKC